MSPPRKSTHPTISDVALALAQRSSPPQSKVGLERVRTGEWTIAVEVGSTDARVAKETAKVLALELDEEFPRTNGGET